MKKKESEKTVYRNRSFDRSEENDLQLWDDKQKEYNIFCFLPL
jgi:hypothetical protein